MSAETYDKFRQVEFGLLESSETIKILPYGYGDLNTEGDIMTDEEVMQHLPMADIELRTAAAIFDGAADIERRNTVRLRAATAELNDRASKIETATDRLKKALAKPTAS